MWHTLSQRSKRVGGPPCDGWRLGCQQLVQRPAMVDSGSRPVSRRTPRRSSAFVASPAAGPARLHPAGAHGRGALGGAARPGYGRRIRLPPRRPSGRGSPASTPTASPDGDLAPPGEAAQAHWKLDTLAAAGSAIKRSQVRRVLRAEGVRWRRPRSYTWRYL